MFGFTYPRLLTAPPWLRFSHQGAERLSSNQSFVSPMDETLDKEVLLLFQGPSPEHMSQEFKNNITKLVSGKDV